MPAKRLRIEEKEGTDPPKARLFFALWPPVEIAAELTAIARHGAELFGGRSTRQETIHLTLAFLGDVDEERLPVIIGAASRINAAHFQLNIDCLDFWHHNHLLWAGCTAPPATLLELVTTLRHELAKDGILADAGYPSFTPHLSLVRRVPEAKAPGVSVPLPVIGPMSWPCNSFVLVRSRLSSDGPDYQSLAEFPLIQ